MLSYAEAEHKVKENAKKYNLPEIEAARDLIKEHYHYEKIASRLKLDELYIACMGLTYDEVDDEVYIANFKEAVLALRYEERISEVAFMRMSGINIDNLKYKRDLDLSYQSLNILMDRYLLKYTDLHKTSRIELPQWLFMRVACNLADEEDIKKTYDMISTMQFMPSTPTLFNAGLRKNQMSSCYLTTVEDDLDDIFKSYADVARLSKWAGGIGTSWTKIRAIGSIIRGTQGNSCGLIPFLKIFNDICIAVNQGGKRKGAMAVYLENWHKDFPEFLDLKKNTGDDRRRTHDLHLVAYISDLFMKRVEKNEDWSLFCPSDVSELTDTWGEYFEKFYIKAENNEKIPRDTINARYLWRKMLTSLYETGHPWVTFKDTINRSNPQKHAGIVRGSNLCTEITLNTNRSEQAVCNLGSLNLAKFKDCLTDEFVKNQLKETIYLAIKFLNKVIDDNYYPNEEARLSNIRHRPIGLGIMGLQDWLILNNINYESYKSLQAMEKLAKLISYTAIRASAKLAQERGTFYPSYNASAWYHGILPEMTRKDYKEDEDDEELKELSRIVKKGMFNSQIMAIAPTATIANICGVYPCFEPLYKNVYMKENLSGSFCVINKYLIQDLEEKGIWSEELMEKIFSHSGSLQNITEIPKELKSKYKEAFEINPEFYIEKTAVFQKYVDQACSTNIFVDTHSGKMLNDIYMRAWKKGLKTTYYLRNKGASTISKTTDDSVDIPNCNITNKEDCEVCD